jgi:hypothetical protein
MAGDPAERLDMTIELRFLRGFPVRGARSAVLDIFDTAGLSGVSGFATQLPRSPMAAATGLIPRERLNDTRHRHETKQPDVPLPSGAR